MAGIIKADRIRAPKRIAQPIAFNLDDINAQTDAYLDRVRDQAEAIVSQAKEQASQVIQVAQRDGQQEAVQVAQQLAESKLDQQLQTLLPALQQAAHAIQQSKDAWLRNWEQKAIHLSVAIAERVIRRKLPGTIDVAEELVREALELATGNDRIQIHLCPADHEALRDRVATLTSQMSNLAPVEIVANPDVTPGGCLLKTEFGEIDQRFESQLARIEDELS